MALESITELASLSQGGAASSVSVVIVPLLVLLIALAVWTGLSHAISVTPRARRLFLSIKMRPESGGQRVGSAINAHLLSLDLRGALVVSPSFVARGDHVKLDLGSHPDYPETPLSVDAVVASFRAMGGHPETYLLKVRFSPGANAPRRELTRFLETLGGAPAGLSHA